MPKEGIKRIDYLKYKFGGIEIARPMYERMAEEGKKEGLSFVFDKIILTPNTSLSHLLIKLAYRKKIGLKIINEIFKSYFQDGIDIGNINNLIKIGKKFNLEEKEIKDFLLSEVEMKKINLSDSDARSKGITGVPFFNINNNTYISGAQSTENLIEAIKTNL
jgi:predicted DsbA family dithiol-disulfide isomerase